MDIIYTSPRRDPPKGKRKKDLKNEVKKDER